MPGYFATRAIKQTPPPTHQLDGTLTEALDDPGTDLQVALETHERKWAQAVKVGWSRGTFGTTGWPHPAAHTDPMAWYFHVVEQDDHSWMCRHGRRVFDVHRFLADALVHITDLAAASEPAEVFVHRLDGSVENLPAQA